MHDRCAWFMERPLYNCLFIINFVGNKAKGRISKRVFQENKSTPNFPKNEHFLPLIRTRTCAYQRVRNVWCAYQGVRNVCFSENLACFVFMKHPFWDSPFCRITDDLWEFDWERIRYCIYFPSHRNGRFMVCFISQ